MRVRESRNPRDSIYNHLVRPHAAGSGEKKRPTTQIAGVISLAGVLDQAAAARQKNQRDSPDAPAGGTGHLTR